MYIYIHTYIYIYISISIGCHNKMTKLVFHGLFVSIMTPLTIKKNRYDSSSIYVCLFSDKLKPCCCFL